MDTENWSIAGELKENAGDALENRIISRIPLGPESLFLDDIFNHDNDELKLNKFVLETFLLIQLQICTLVSPIPRFHSAQYVLSSRDPESCRTVAPASLTITRTPNMFSGTFFCYRRRLGCF